jgi:hypothetical protein
LLSSLRSLTKIPGSGTGPGAGSISQRYGCADRIRTKMSRIHNTAFFRSLKLPHQDTQQGMILIGYQCCRSVNIFFGSGLLIHVFNKEPGHRSKVRYRYPK